MAESEKSSALSALSSESRSFPPSEEFASQANATADWYDRADDDREGFWAEQADRLHWTKKWDTVLDWQPPFAKWFVGGELNVAYNCADRHVEAGNGDRVAIHWEGEPGDSRTITYADLQREVSKTANALTELGVGKGDRVAIQLPMIPEAVFSMLACARLGALHSVVFGGFSPGALKARIEDAEAKVLITSDGQYRRGKPAPMKENTDEAVAGTSIEKVLVVKRTETDVPWTDGRDVWWHDVVDGASDQHTPESFDSEHPLFILYTSGTHREAEGHPAHLRRLPHAVRVHPQRGVRPQAGESVYWCTADIGWVTGHTYIVYGPLANGATQVIYEGTPNTPHEGRHWEIVDKYKVSIYYTAPTLIRTFMKWGEDIPAKYDLSSLRVLGTVGEPINPEAWMWFREKIGKERCPIVDTWWQTETGSQMIAPLPGVTATKPGSAMRALPGISATVVDDTGTPVGNGEGGYLVLDKPWPSMLRGIWGDTERYKETYWSRFAEQGYYFAGDGAKYDDDGASGCSAASTTS
ncbi:acetate--CoA ligase [Pseudonocardia sp. ICBG601]|uniref:acetate--CoA ligase n=1 Tax=Pseudonocardia sp. ICBG601 TaxID=2846759 RepID=UPI001CF66663|nr:acetate--CoA ligase [Pseudonocardia sp. ICBG601]